MHLSGTWMIATLLLGNGATGMADRDSTADAASRTAPMGIAAVSPPSDAQLAANTDYLYWKSNGFENEYYRYFAISEGVKGRWDHAAELFRIASRYADKYSQHRLSMLYWHGVGVERDPVVAYIWADLAAERGDQSFLAIREKMWGELTPEQQAAVPVRGREFYAIYGDEVAFPKFRAMFTRARFVHNAFGSEKGFLRIDRFYLDRYLAQERKARVHRDPQVNVGELKTTGGSDDATDDGTESGPAAEPDTPMF